MLRSVVVAGSLSLVLLMTAPGAVAASLEVSAEAPPPLEPLAAPVGADVTVAVPCALVDDTAPPPVYVNASTASTAIHATVSPPVLLPDADACADGTWTGTVSLLLSAAPDAVAASLHTVTLTATVTNGSITATASTDVSVEMAFYSLLDVRPAKTTVKADLGSPAGVDLLLANEGNAKTRLTFELVDMPDEWRVHLPGTVDLGSLVAGGTASTAARVEVVPTGDFTETTLHEVRVRVTAALAADPSVAGDAVVATFGVLVEAAMVPFGGLVLLAGAGAGAALLRRR